VSGVISFSDDPDDNWMLGNHEFRLVLAAAARHVERPEDRFALDQGEAFNGLLLDRMDASQRARLIEALRLALIELLSEVRDKANPDERAREFARTLELRGLYFDSISAKRFDPRQWVRANAHRLFLTTHRFTPEEVAGQLATQALRAGCGHVDTLRADDWWVVGGDRDWLEADAFERFAVLDNGVRPSFLVSTFAERVLVARHGEISTVKGRPTDDVRALLVQRHYGHAVAFR
jgi:hypothetical protein